MTQIQTQELTPEALAKLSPAQVYQLYNGMDCCLTVEILEELSKLTNNAPNLGYDFSRALQAPILEIMLRGFRVDERARVAMGHKLRAERQELMVLLNRLAIAAWGSQLNANSSIQLQKFFYDHMGLPKIWVSKKGERKLSMDREILEKLEVYFHAQPFVATILAIRERDKTLQFLETELSQDGRFRTSYNIAGTETFRLSSSASSDGTGGNAQNIAPGLRRVLCADPGYKLFCADLEQAESREVGLICGKLFDDWRYLDACEGSDLHTLVCKLIWPELPWTGDKKSDRAIADKNFYREYSYRDMAKRGGHGSNYYGTPFTMARHLKVPTRLMEDFQGRYFGAFPAIPKWHQWVATTLQTTHHIENAFGVGRDFFGRSGDDTTLREAIAHGPQSSTAMRTNLGLWKIWKHMGTRVQLLAQTHDSITFQYREDDNEAEIVQQALALMEDIWLEAPNGRRFSVPAEAKVGWSWGPWDATRNPNGLMKWKGHDSRKRLSPLDDPLP